MNQSNMRFDPYTGDPIPDDTAAEEVQSNQPYSTPESTPTQDENSGSFAPNESGAESPQYGTSQPTPEQPQYGTSQAAPEQPQYGTSQVAPEQPQYNPYTGQPISENSGSYSQDDAEKDRKSNIYATVSLVCGIASILFSFCTFCCCPFITFVVGIVGIVFGCISKNSMGIRKGTAVAGIITSAIGLALMLILTVVEFISLMSSDNFWDAFQREFQNGLNGSGYNWEVNPNDSGSSYDDGIYQYNFDSYDDYDNDVYSGDDFYN